MIQDTAYLCPSCGSPSVSYGELEGTEACCDVCAWRGPRTEMVGANFSHDFTSRNEMINRMVADLKNIMAAGAAKEFAGYLLKWGFLSQPIQTTQVARYFAAMAAGIVTAVIDERKKIEEETHERTTG